MIDAIAWRFQAGSQWIHLPEKYGNWRGVYTGCGCGPLLEAKRDRSYLDRSLRKHAKALETVVGACTRKVARRIPIHPKCAASFLDELAAGDAAFTVDTGMANVRRPAI